MRSLGEIVSKTRKQRGLTQQQLAIRAGTKQAAISRIECGEVSPTFETFKKLLLVMGERPVVTTERLPTHYDPVHMADNVKRTPRERLIRALGWDRMLHRFATEGRRVRDRERAKALSS